MGGFKGTFDSRAGIPGAAGTVLVLDTTGSAVSSGGTLPATSGAGYLYDDGSGNRSWEQVEGGNDIPGLASTYYSTFANSLDLSSSATIPCIDMLFNNTANLGFRICYAGGNVYFQALTSGGFHDEIACNAYFEANAGTTYLSSQGNTNSVAIAPNRTQAAYWDGNGNFTQGAGDTTINSTVVSLPNLPTSDPGVAGQLWNNAGVLSVSAGLS